MFIDLNLEVTIKNKEDKEISLRGYPPASITNISTKEIKRVLNMITEESEKFKATGIHNFDDYWIQIGIPLSLTA